MDGSHAILSEAEFERWLELAAAGQQPRLRQQSPARKTAGTDRNTVRSYPEQARASEPLRAAARRSRLLGASRALAAMIFRSL